MGGLLRRYRLWRHRRLRNQQRPGAEQTLHDFEKLIGYQFENPRLLLNALRHRSILAEIHAPRSEVNERLEFLGDAALDLIVSEHLFKKYPNAREGYLARMKSLAVSGRQLASKAKKLELGQYLQLSISEQKTGGRSRRSILEDALEAVIGALYLDGGLKVAKRFIRKFVIYDLDGRLVREKEGNYKSLLLEYAQGNAMGHPHYRVIGEDGPDHAKVFSVEVAIGGDAVGKGIGKSKKQAEQEAARAAAEMFDLHIE